MAFDRIQRLGDEKWQKILNALMRGTAAMALARTIQCEWGDFQQVSEKTLTQQLNRLRIAAAEGMFGAAIANQIKSGATPQIRALEGISLSAAERMEEAAVWQRQRLIDLIKKEKLAPVPTEKTLVATNAVFTDYTKLLQDIQKIRFDLGLDEYRGILPSVGRMKGASEHTTYPDGTQVQRQVFEAVTAIEDIFNRRQIPQVIDVP